MRKKNKKNTGRERWRQVRETDKSECHREGRGGEDIRWTDRTAEGGREQGRGEEEREKQLSSCPSPHAERTPPWGDSDFKPLPCFIFPWLLQPDQSS